MNLHYAWPADELARSLCIIADEMIESPQKRQRLKTLVRKRLRRGNLALDGITTLVLYHLCCADLYRQRYRWIGWECRSRWAWEKASLDWTYPRWDGSQCNLLVLGEQGLGDEMLFASCLPELLEQCERVTYECDPRLIPIFERTYPGVRFVSRFSDDARRPWPEAYYAAGDYDAFIPAGDLPKLYRTNVRDFVFRPLLAHSGLRPRYYLELSRLGPPPYIGVAWGGRLSRIDPDPLLCGPGTFINLQYDGQTHPGVHVLEQPSLDHTFALIACLEQVRGTIITPIHMAGRLGLPTEVVLPAPVYADPDNPNDESHNRLRWEWPRGPATPWHPSVQIHQDTQQWTHSRKTPI